MSIKKIGKYDVISELGKGAMGVVYKAQDPMMGRFVAIKTMSEMLADNVDLTQRFYREAQSAGKLRHPNIVTIYDMGEEKGMPYIAMELIEGTDLEDIIARKIPLHTVQKLNILIQVCRGLEYAHNEGIVHRDIKPANIRVLPDGKSVKIMDFGIARTADSNMTRAGMVMGTVSYMSPEQITAPQTIDRRSDLFSVGVILYEFFAYCLPFQGETIPSILTAIVHGSYTPLKTYAPTCPPGLEEILRHALAKERTERYQNCAEMARELETLVDALKPQAIQELLQRGQWEMEQHHLDAAKNNYENVLALQSTHEIARTFLKKIDELRGKSSLLSPSISGEASRATIMPEQMPAAVNRSGTGAQPAPAFCTQCGTQVRQGVRFCPQCGSEILGAIAAPQRAAVPQRTAVSTPVPAPAPSLEQIPEIVPPSVAGSAQRASSKAPWLIVAALVIIGLAAGVYFLFLAPGTQTSVGTRQAEEGQAGSTEAPPATILSAESNPTPTQPPAYSGEESGSSRTRTTMAAETIPTVKRTDTAASTRRTVTGGTLPILADPVLGTPTRTTQPPIEEASAGQGTETQKSLIEPAKMASAIEPPTEIVRNDPPPAVETREPERPAPPPTQAGYAGPREGTIEWTGEVQKGDVVIIENSSASQGSMTGRLPGVPCLVNFQGEKVSITESPGISNQWKRLGLRFDKKGKSRVSIRWQVLSHVR